MAVEGGFKNSPCYSWHFINIIFCSVGVQLVLGDPAREPADVDGDRDVDVQQRSPELHHVPADKPDEDQERQRPDADDRWDVVNFIMSIQLKEKLWQWWEHSGRAQPS